MQIQEPSLVLAPAQEFKEEEMNRGDTEHKELSQPASLKGKVSIKYQRFPNHASSIKYMSLSSNNVLAISNGNQGSKIKFVTVNQKGLELELSELKLFRSITMRHSFIQWSPNGEYLAVGGSHLAIWKWEDDQIQLHKEYTEDFYDIYGFAWAPNSQRFAVASINSQMALVIRDITQQGKIKEIKDISILVALQWDPFNKHLACLSCDNVVNIYNCNTWLCVHSIDLSVSAKKKVEPKSLIMKIDWSPDFRYILAPSIDNKPISYVTALERNSAFSVKGLFMGPFSTINCVRFNPNLYQLPTKQIVSVFAMGDSQGNIAIWLIGDKYKSKKPLMLFKAGVDQDAIIENLIWNSQGNVLYATAFNNYIITIAFEHKVFGRVLEEEEKHSILENLYGSTKAVDTEFKVFRVGNSKPKEIQRQEPEVSKVGGGPKNQYVFTTQKVINITGNKKKIQPSILVKASQKEAVERKNNVSPPPAPITQKHPVSPNINKSTQQSKVQPQRSELAYGPSVTPKLIIQNMLSLSVLAKKQTSYRISPEKHLQIQSKQNQELVLVYYKSSQDRRELLSTITIPGKINYFQHSDEKILIYSSEGYIYLFSEAGTALELPMLVGQLHLIKMKNMDLLTISTNCNLRFFNLKQKRLYTNTNILDLIGNNLKTQPNKVVTKAIQYIMIGDNHEITLQMINKKKFLLNQSTLSWHLVPNEIYSPNEFQEQERFKQMYPSIDQTLSRFSKSFFEAMIKPPVVTTVQQLEYNLIYFKDHAPNPEKFSVTLVNYIKQLSKLSMDGKLREVLLRYLVEKSQGQHLRTNTKQLVDSIKQINSKVISEFIELNLF